MKTNRFNFRVWHKPSGQFLDECEFRIDYSGDIYLFYNNEYNYDGQNECVLQQSTGLEDSIGNEIYEGDICNIRRYEHLDKTKSYLKAKVVWGCEHGWNFRTNFGNDFIGTRFTEVEQIEVIGNIFENPELLN